MPAPTPPRRPPPPPAPPVAIPSPDLAEGDAVSILDDLVWFAVSHGASDIHLEPKHDRLRVRFRIDGAMVEQRGIARDLASQVVSRVKVLARMDIAERRMPQDGQLALDFPGRPRIHLRASTFPCSQGEKCVLRILMGHALLPFEKLGMALDVQARVRDLSTREQGFVVTAGPTGSGKTSTLYSLLSLIDAASVNVVTLEDPIEVEIDSITQGQTHVRSGFSFASGLRAILRQDPDVILVGEIRDAETAGIALQASLTGHLVMSTLHTSTTVDTVVRLVDLGIESWIIANALSAVVAQRLVRTVCTVCREIVPLADDVHEDGRVVLPRGTLVPRAKGCAKCMQTGYRGRTGIFELMEIDDEIRELIKLKAAPREYRTVMRTRNVTSLRRAGLEAVRAALTTVDEVARVTAG